MRTTQAWLRPGFALAMAYVFVLQTVLALSLSTAHASRTALAPDPTQILCLAAGHDGGDNSAGERQASGKIPPGKTVPPESCALCAFAGTGFIPPTLADFVPLDRAFLRVTNATEWTFALRSPAPTPRLSQGPPRTA
ncbi:MAG: hypothetical protein B7Y12_05400 [Rhizobiales bacterium 24-66-13]|nr:MAG: hypothetical protein B7Y12_05400 [Rhizobiales bacterium 24-66-13]OZB02835.1 MAG: hypothetical protein B7X67_18885 [Rhizobiales bacterium 39-66-18]